MSIRQRSIAVPRQGRAHDTRQVRLSSSERSNLGRGGSHTKATAGIIDTTIILKITVYNQGAPEIKTTDGKQRHGPFCTKCAKPCTKRWCTFKVSTRALTLRDGKLTPKKCKGDRKCPKVTHQKCKTSCLTPTTSVIYNRQAKIEHLPDARTNHETRFGNPNGWRFLPSGTKPLTSKSRSG